MQGSAHRLGSPAAADAMCLDRRDPGEPWARDDALVVIPLAASWAQAVPEAHAPTLAVPE